MQPFIGNYNDTKVKVRNGYRPSCNIDTPLHPKILVSSKFTSKINGTSIGAPVKMADSKSSTSFGQKKKKARDATFEST